MQGLSEKTVAHLNEVAQGSVGDFCDTFNNPEYARWREQLTGLFLARVTEQDQVLSFLGNCCLVMSERQVLSATDRLRELHPSRRQKAA